MRSQEQAFRAYYASMPDTDLLQVAANRKSFIDVAQKTLTEELAKRHLTAPGPPLPAIHHSFLWRWTQRLHHHPASP